MSATATSSASIRQSNFELLRILSMLAIIAQHLMTQGDVLRHIANPVPDPTYPLALCMASGGRIATQVFLLIGCWFLVDAPRFRPDRWIRLWAQVLFYSAPLSLWMLAIGRTNAHQAFRGCLPILGRPLWFAAAWLILMLAAPFLRQAFCQNARRARWSALALFVPLCAWGTFFDARVGFYAEVIWFFAVFLMTGFLKHHTDFFQRVPRIGSLIAALAIFGAMTGIVLVAAQADRSSVLQAAGTFAKIGLQDLKSLPNFVCALLIFAFFVRLDIGRIRIVNLLARPAFGVYVAHQVPSFISYFWYGLCHVDRWYRRPDAVWIAIGVTIAVYLVLAAVDLLRGYVADFVGKKVEGLKG